jgi:hypothetical protein
MPLSTPFSYMATLHELSVFESLFESALEEYEVQTEINLVRHPLTAQLEPCNTVESITEVLQGQVQSFRELPEAALTWWQPPPLMLGRHVQEM